MSVPLAMGPLGNDDPAGNEGVVGTWGGGGGGG